MTRAGTGEVNTTALPAVLSVVSYALELAIIVASYIGLSEVTLLLPALNPAATPLWPPTGVALALVLLRGYRVWPGILVGAISASAASFIRPDAMTVGPLLEPTSIGIGTTLAALAGAWLINRWSHGCKTFTTMLGIAKFELICFVPTAMISSVIAIASIGLTSDPAFADYAGPWTKWWLADAAGTAIIVPVIVLWAMTPFRLFSRSNVLETTAIFVAVAAIGVIAYLPLIAGDLNELLPYRGMLGFLILLPLMWAGLRGNQREGATAALIFCGLAAWGFSVGASPFPSADLNESLVLLLLLSISTSVVPLILGAAVAVRRDLETRLLAEQKHALELAIQNGKHEVEGWLIRKNGTPFFATGVLTAIRDDNGNLVGLASVIRDATERRDTQEKLVEAREQLAVSQKMEAIGKLTGGIAHDFNNLLMIIGGNAQTFKRLLDPKLPRAIEAIQTAAKRGESLTRQLLTFSRRQHLSPTVVDLNTSIRNMRTMLESSLRGNIVYDENIAHGIWPTKVDLAELELAIVNIAVNARDAMPNGGTFTLTAGNVETDESLRDDENNQGYVAISFSDSGMGIPPNLLSKIFDPFFTTKEVGKGTGLGLSQVYGFPHQAGGTVTADSTVGEGTTITIYLPSCSDEAGAAEEAAVIDTQRLQRPMVLVVDDSAEVAEGTSSLFEHLGYDTVYRDSAEAALKLLSEGAKIDLVFSDIVMPGTIDGVGLAAEVRARYPHLPVILTTGYSDAAQAAPPDLKISRKPFDSDMLRGFIQDTMEMSLAS